MPRKFFTGLLVIFCLVVFGFLVIPLAVVAQSPDPTQQITPLEPQIGGDSSSPAPQEIGALATSIFYPDDAPVREGSPNATAPNELYLGAGYDDGSLYGSSGRVRSYLRFDLSGLPANSTVVSATRRIYQAGGRDYVGRVSTVTIYRVTSNWTETGLTWNNRSSYAEAVGSVLSTYDYTGWLSLNLTSLVQSWANGSQTNYGLVAVGPESPEGLYRVFASGETANRPELQISYLPAPPPVLDVSPGTLSAQVSSSQSPFGSPLKISNVTGSSLNWTATKIGSASWLTFNPASGTGVTPTNPANLNLTINPTGLPSGTHTAQIRISSTTPNIANSPLTATYTLNVVNRLSDIYLPIILGSGGGSSSPQVAALVIGIADYQYLGPAPASGNLPEIWGYDLVQPYNDVTKFINWLKTRLKISPNNIIQMSEEAATYDRVTGDISGTNINSSAISAFQQLDQMENEDTLVIIYYSGHGGQTPDTNGDESDGYDEFIAMYDTDLTPGGYVRVVTDDQLQALLAPLESKHIVMIFDSCFSGGLTGAAIQSLDTNNILARGLVNPFASDLISTQGSISEIAGPGRVVITGGTGNQITWESASLQNGVFTYFFLQSLQDSLHDVNQNQRISAEEAYWFSQSAVDEWVSTNVISNTVIHQNPAINDQHFDQVNLTWLP